MLSAVRSWSGARAAVGTAVAASASAKRTGVPGTARSSHLPEPGATSKCPETLLRPDRARRIWRVTASVAPAERQRNLHFGLFHPREPNGAAKPILTRPRTQGARLAGATGPRLRTAGSGPTARRALRGSVQARIGAGRRIGAKPAARSEFDRRPWSTTPLADERVCDRPRLGQPNFM